MKNQTKQKTKVFFILGIVFGAFGLIGLIGNLIYAISNISYYVAYGYALIDVLPSYIYSILQPIATFGGVSAILFALSVIVNRMPILAAEEADLIETIEGADGSSIISEETIAE